MTDTLLTPTDLAAVLGVTEVKVMEWRRQYNWPHVRIGRRLRWTPEQVEQIVRQHAVDGAALVPLNGRTQRSANRRRSA